jgi:hypothetical protein
MSTVTLCRWTICGWKPARTVFMGCRITTLNWSSLNPAKMLTLITISFLNRTVRIKGKNLRNLGVALQMRGVESIKPMAERYSSLAAGEDGWVKSIEILEQKEDAHA